MQPDFTGKHEQGGVRDAEASGGWHEAGHSRGGGRRETSVINDLSQAGSFLIKFC